MWKRIQKILAIGILVLIAIPFIIYVPIALYVHYKTKDDLYYFQLLRKYDQPSLSREEGLRLSRIWRKKVNILKDSLGRQPTEREVDLFKLPEEQEKTVNKNDS